MKKVISIIALISVFTTVFTGCEDIQNNIATSSNISLESNLTDTISTTEPITEETTTDTQATIDTQPADTPTTQPTASETQKQPSLPAPTISMQVDKTVAENDAVIQIPLFNANSNAGADALNTRISNELQSVYTQYSNSGDDVGWIDISSYTFSSDKYVQVVSLLGEFPSYGTDGKIFSYNYDVMNGTALDISTVMNRFSVTQNDLESAMATAFKPESETRKLVSVEPTAFRIGEDGTVDIYMYVYSDDPNSTPDTRIWIYNSQSKVCFQYDKNSTFK